MRKTGRFLDEIRPAIPPTYIDIGESDIPAISHNLSEATIASDIKIICQIYFRDKCFSKLNVS
jgi:hypothetical protein